MIKIRKNRLYAVLFIFGSSLLATVLVLTALNQNINLFYSPSDLLVSNPSQNKSIRIGGLVQKGSLIRVPDSLEINFTITDLKEEVTVNYSESCQIYLKKMLEWLQLDITIKLTIVFKLLKSWPNMMKIMNQKK